MNGENFGLEPKPDPKPAKKAKKSKAKPKANWLPICRFPLAEDFDEETGKYIDAHVKVELQQEQHSKVIRTVKIDGWLKISTPKTRRRSLRKAKSVGIRF